MPISSLDLPTQESFKILEAENQKWEEHEVRSPQTIMLQNQILLTSIEDLKLQLKERDQRLEQQTQALQAQNDTLLAQTNYLVEVTQKNEHFK
jgi:hypothetical protein